MQRAAEFVQPHRGTVPYMLRRVVGESMYPTLEHGKLIVIKRCTHYQVGDVIVFTRKGVEKIKRISGVEGDFAYVLGDNPTYSKDSRQYGYIPLGAVVGKVILPKTTL